MDEGVTVMKTRVAKRKASLIVAASAGALVATGAPATAFADVLTGTMTVDNGYFAYVSTSNNTLGTLIGSGTNWPTSTSVASSNLGPGTYYLHIEAINQGLWGGVLGNFSVGSQSFSTSGTGWAAVFNNYNSSFTPQPWVAPDFSNPADAVTVYGPNNGTTSPWGPDQGGSPIAGISTSADWIDGTGPNALDEFQTGSVCTNGDCTVDFSYAFTVPSAPGPIPGAGFAGLAALALAGLWARTRHA